MGGKCGQCLLMVCVAVVLASGVANASFTVATFADPSNNSNKPLFTVDWSTNTVTGGWADSESNLDLVVMCTHTTYNDVWFEFSPVTIISTASFGGRTMGVTNGGQINFYASGKSKNESPGPLVTVTFTKGFVSQQSMGASDLFGEGVTISGAAFPCVYENEEFSFAFANIHNFPNNTGFTATSSFTSSASAPEPATLLFLMSGIGFWMRKKK